MPAPQAPTTSTHLPGVVGDLVVGQERYDSPDAQELIAAVQQEYVERYGGPDATPVEPGQFAPPYGLFLVGRIGGAAVACGGWRVSAPGVGEVKRMYVAPAYRRRGVARLLLAEIERTAAAAGLTRLRLETGPRQPESVALYQSAGWQAAEPFGHYACAPDARYFARDLPPALPPG